MTNAAKFKEIFGMCATELWSKSYKEFSDWLNEDVMAIVAVEKQPSAMFEVPYGQDPYSAIGNYIQENITSIEDMIAVIDINGVKTNELFMIDNEGFTWYSDWYEGEMNVVLIDFFPLRNAINSFGPSAQQNACEFWDSESNLCALHRPSGQHKITEDDVKEWLHKICASHRPPAQPEITEDDVKEWLHKRNFVVIDSALYVEMKRRCAGCVYEPVEGVF